MKKWWVWVIGIFAVLIVYGAVTGVNQAKEEIAEGDSSGEGEAVAEAEAEEVEEPPAELSREEEIQALVENVLEDELNNTEIRETSVNLDAGKEDGNYVVLPKLTWDVKNNTKNTRDMLELYSDRIASHLGDEEDINEITVFWEVPYHLEGNNVAKFNFERAGDSMAVGDVWYAPLIQD